MGIPAVTGLSEISTAVPQRARVVIDGLEGALVVEPDRETTQNTQKYAKVIRSLTRERHRVAERMPYQVATADGQPIDVLCNIDTAEKAHDLADAGFAGVGLFRTEFLYLGRTTAPDEDAQSSLYADLLRAFGPRPVVIRTMDFGADKFDDRMNVKEPNPFLGLRSIRLSFEREEIFRAQIRAILRASPFGSARILFPLITDAAEFRRARAIVDSVKADLAKRRVRFAPSVPVGAMVELPAAALEASRLLEVADFLSIGSNDLTQYTLAVDRTNGRVAHLFRPHHPSVCRLIDMTVKAGLQARKPVSLCGEMAGNPRYVPLLIGLGLRSLSMAPTRAPVAIDLMRGLTVPACEDLARAVLDSADADEAGAHLDAGEGPQARDMTRGHFGASQSSPQCSLPPASAPMATETAAT
jgi:phosphotransferase system enzyme I (PtsI)